MAASADPDTKTRLLDAAERAFAERGFAAASLRRIIAEAGVNLAAANYHFGSKSGLIRAVFARRIGPLNAERLARLEELSRAAGRRAPALEDIIEALIRPALRLAHDPAFGGANIMRLYGRTIAEPGDALQTVFQEQFGEVARRFTEAFQRACPRLPATVLQWRLHFTIGAMAHVMCDPTNVRRFTNGLCDPRDTEEVVGQMKSFLAAGFQADVSSNASRRRTRRRRAR